MEPGLRVYGGDSRVGALTQRVSHLTALKVKGGTCRTLGILSLCRSCTGVFPTELGSSGTFEHPWDVVDGLIAAFPLSQPLNCDPSALF